MKRTIVLYAYGSSAWAGGLYYLKNVAFQLSQNKHIMDEYQVVVYCTQQNLSYFSTLPESIKVEAKDFSSGFVGRLQKLFGFVKNKVVLIYPNAYSTLPQIAAPVWIPDFQINYLSEMFTEKEIISRKNWIREIAESKRPLVLSSNDCLKDFRKFYSKTKKNVYVVPFVSFIEPEIRTLTLDEEITILEKYELKKKKYIMVANQFWKHKNHIVVFKAIQNLIDNKNIGELRFVFTGKMQDDRNPEYIEELKAFFSDKGFAAYARNLGFVDRKEQIAIMKNARFLIQPSLFEGWGTVVEDGKVLNKLILLSDIPIHREQKNENCTLFNPYNSDELASEILRMWSNEHYDNVEYGIEDMYQRAETYSCGFEKMLEEVT